MLPDAVFVAMAREVGHPKPEHLAALGLRQRELHAQGQAASLYDLARLAGLVTPEQAAWFEAVHARNQVPVPVPAPASAPSARSTSRRRAVSSTRLRAVARPDDASPASSSPRWVWFAGGAIVLSAIAIAALLATRGAPPAPAPLVSSAPAPGRPTTSPSPARPSAAARDELVARVNEEAVQVRALVRDGRCGLALARIDGLSSRFEGDPAATDALRELAALRAWVVEQERAKSTSEPPPAPTEAPPERRPRRIELRLVTEGSPPEPTEPPPPPPPPAPAPTPAPTPTATDAPLVSPAAALDPGYLARRAAATDAAALVKLSRWAAEQELFEEEKDALVLALRADSGHARARARLDELLAEEKRHARFATPWRREAQVLFVETNTSQAWLRYYCDSVAAYYRKFSRVFRVPQDPVHAWGRKIGVKIFATRADFDRYQREKGSSLSESAVGYYSFGDKELVLFHDPSAVDETLTTLFHEGTHLFCHLALGERIQKLPIWVLEGIAEYFGTARFDRAKKEVDYGQVNGWRLIDARALVARGDPSLKGDLLAYTDYATFGAERYALAWALVHMLLEKRRPGAEKPLYRDRFVAYFDAVSNGADPVQTFEAAIGPIPALEAEWKAWIRDLPLSPLDEGLSRLTRGDAAGALPLLEAHRRAAPQEAKGAYWLGRTLEALERVDEAARAYRAAVELEPQHEEALVGLASCLLALDRAPDAVVAAAQAVRVRASGEHQALLGAAAVAAGQKAVAVPALREAIALLGPTPELLALRSRADALP